MKLAMDKPVSSRSMLIQGKLPRWLHAGLPSCLLNVRRSRRHHRTESPADSGKGHGPAGAYQPAPGHPGADESLPSSSQSSAPSADYVRRPGFAGLASALKAARSGALWASPPGTSSSQAQAGKRMRAAPGLVPARGGLPDLQGVAALGPSCWAPWGRTALVLSSAPVGLLT